MFPTLVAMPKPPSPDRYPHDPEFSLPDRFKNRTAEEELVRQTRAQARSDGESVPPFYGTYDRARLGE